MRRVVILANSEKPRALELARAAEREAANLGAEALVSTREGEDLSGAGAQLAVVFGGDGTVLGAVSALGEAAPPVLAFNTGHLGYLAENPPDAMRDILRQAFEGGLQESRRMMIEGLIGGVPVAAALNEFIVSYRRNNRPLSMSVTVDGEELMRLRGDGVIIATPTGSTAYSLSAGGPVMSPELSAIVFTPLCPHQLANRSLVLNPAETIGVTHHGSGSGGGGDIPAEVIADGRHFHDLPPGEEFTVRVARRRVTFLRQARGRYRLLREKLGWGWRAGG